MSWMYRARQDRHDSPTAASGGGRAWHPDLSQRKAMRVDWTPTYESSAESPGRAQILFLHDDKNGDRTYDDWLPMDIACIDQYTLFSCAIFSSRLSGPTKPLDPRSSSDSLLKEAHLFSDPSFPPPPWEDF
ncbi:hypothetical protein PGT21_008999 [Puccinia graminis f. sp. tritici]|uniref:Uncharacterized protein n=1 Tax=Puccinia graminis f. sp. tritici TaxID=56615 RepID=A0A5B0N9U0_PUCGR|nr:hypothetical protein PGT21_008999 [Puccinia graminis f. sp. tritici]